MALCRKLAKVHIRYSKLAEEVWVCWTMLVFIVHGVYSSLLYTFTRNFSMYCTFANPLRIISVCDQYATLLNLLATFTATLQSQEQFQLSNCTRKFTLYRHGSYGTQGSPLWMISVCNSYVTHLNSQAPFTATGLSQVQCELYTCKSNFYNHSTYSNPFLMILASYIQVLRFPTL